MDDESCVKIKLGNGEELDDEELDGGWYYSW
jgi:hypothetical protein